MPRDLIPSEVRDFSEEQQVEHNERRMTDQELNDFISQSREMIILRENKAVLEKREAELKKHLMAVLADLGDPYGPEGQHRAVEFPSPIRGIVRMVRQSKSSTTVDEIQAEAIARSRNLYERLFRPVMTLDQDAVMVAVAEGIITDEELEQIFPRKQMSAFVMEKEKRQ